MCGVLFFTIQDAERSLRPKRWAVSLLVYDVFLLFGLLLYPSVYRRITKKVITTVIITIMFAGLIAYFLAGLAYISMKIAFLVYQVILSHKYITMHFHKLDDDEDDDELGTRKEISWELMSHIGAIMMVIGGTILFGMDAYIRQSKGSLQSSIFSFVMLIGLVCTLPIYEDVRTGAWFRRITAADFIQVGQAILFLGVGLFWIFISWKAAIYFSTNFNEKEGIANERNAYGVFRKSGDPWKNDD
jgi:hypothetical protein